MPTRELILACSQGVHSLQQLACSLAFTIKPLNWKALLSKRKKCRKCCIAGGVASGLVAASYYFEQSCAQEIFLRQQVGDLSQA
jgi:hypothetical protein